MAMASDEVKEGEESENEKRREGEDETRGKEKK